ncbi:protein 5NUC-like isoform X5 [Leguminivora glycinivorella]|uniref:protein 5NUC-like isoform X5 n=1 Tax=Leguminivora glycinivorella TaxID=1035111 RepID=UPI00200DEA56|nr:protein 5NUC-like isoform X5 [Leguminivora glycinivorella]
MCFFIMEARDWCGLIFMNLPFIIALLATAALSSSTVIKSPETGAIPPNFELLILHNNDMHARFEQTSQLSGVCTTADREAGKCYGGFPRVATVVKEARRKAASGEGPPVLYLNAGDTYTGTAWFTIYKWKIAAEFINALRPDAVSLGTNDIQAASDQLSPFLNDIKTNILSSNVFPNTKNEKIEKSEIFDVSGVKVAVIGYLTPDTNTVESNNIEYINEIIALKDEVANLKSQDVKIIIALGHSDTDIAQEIARDIEGVDLVINGYRNQYLWSGKSITGELEVLRESTSQTQESGKVVPLLQSVAYDKYLGRINIKFDENGDIEDIKINPILLDKSIPQDSEIVDIINKYSNEVIALNNEVVGNTAVVLDGDSCATEECNLGNLIADAMVYYHALRFEGERWTDAPIAIIHSGAIQDSIAPANRPAAVTRGDLMSALPTESNVVLMEINGTVFNQMLEHAVADYSLRNPSGAFLHFSGVRVVYDFSKEPGSRVVSAVVRCHNCYLPTFYVIEGFRTYPVLMPRALADGEFGYDMLRNPPLDMYEHDELTAVAEYIRLRSPVYPEVAGRIRLLNVDAIDDAAFSLTSCSAITFIAAVTASFPFMQ